MNGPNVTEEPVKLEGFGPKDLYQKREKIFTRFVGGFFQRLRFFTGWPLLTGYFLLPWFNWGGAQAVLFDLPARQFSKFFDVLEELNFIEESRAAGLELIVLFIVGLFSLALWMLNRGIGLRS